MTQNVRIRDLAPGVTAERIASSTHIDYDPTTGSMIITFVAPEYLVLDGTVTDLVGRSEAMRITFDEIATRKFGANELDPVSEVPLDEITVAGIALLIKRAFHLLYNERAQPQG